MKRGLRGSLLLSILVHLVLFALVLFGVDMQAPPKPQQTNTPIIQATAISQSAVEQQVQRIEQRKLSEQRKEQQRVRELQQQAAQARKARQAEQQKIKQLEITRQKQQEAARKAAKEAKLQELAKKKALAQAKRAEALKRTQQAAAAKAKAEAKAAQAAMKKAQEAKRKADLKRRQELEKQKQQQQIQQQLRDQMTKEMRVRDIAKQKQVISEVARYTALIRSAIRNRWRTDPSMAGKQCVLTLQLASSGLVVSVSAGEGELQVCRTARSAILQLETLPVSSDPAVFQKMKTIRLTLTPDVGS